MPVTSPDSKCPICLDRLDNIVYLDPCWHKFCFSCVQEWSKIKAQCPLCQQPFLSLCHIAHAEDDISRPEENEPFSYSDCSTIIFAERTFDLKAWDQHTSSDYSTPLHNEGSSSDSTTLAVFPDEVDSQVLEHGSSKHSVDWLSWNDETPGPSGEYNAIITSPEVLESSDEDSVRERTTLHLQLQVGVDDDVMVKSQTESTSCESTSSRDSSRSWSHHKGHGQRKSSSLDSDCCYRRACYQSSYLLHSPKTAGDSFSCSKSTQTKAHCSNNSPSLESRIQSFTERTDLQSQMGFQERQDSCYKQRRSRSRSSSRSRSPSGEADRTRSKKPGGKRKCKTRHLENTETGSTTMERKYSLPTFSDCYKNKGSLSDNQESSEIKHEEKNNSMGNPSVEGVYEQTEIMKRALKKKCKKKHQEHHWKDA
ncbi:E3 ubiquitin-protein ligase Topors [Lagopus muta]|uniref:E3 ubiquitin-protein ligase Topors n=1 Tax=Lagopus muta TaxID=64668 RepID=UPI00209CF541|nr:E3 ubiquitin-protein ligase Topors [Lagopus muta]